MQSKRQSFIEACVNTAIGLLLALLVNALLMVMVGVKASWAQNLFITAGHTVISVIRTYAIRRFFTSEGWKFFRR